MGGTLTTPTRERPILFSAPMVRALLAGTKTQTRRIVAHPIAQEKAVRWDASTQLFVYEGSRLGLPVFCPYGAPGDRLWVKETFASQRQEQAGTGAVRWLHPDRNSCGALYRADVVSEAAPGRGWRPSIHMPRCLSRITLGVTGVRVERLQDISIDDILAEGVAAVSDEDAVGTFRILWDSINGNRAPLSSNPWVWVVSFRRVQP